MKKSGYVLLAVILVSLWLSIYSMQLRLDMYKGEGGYKGEDFLYLPRADYIKTASLGYEQVVADLLWLKAIQHIGVRNITSEGYDWIYKAIDVVTSLDPKFISPYEVGGLMLSLSDKVELSNKLLTKGSENNPEIWNFPFYLGFNYLYYMKDYRQAAAWIARAAAIKGSPPYLPLLASRLYVQAEDPVYALEFLTRMYSSTTNEKVREGILERMNELKAQLYIKELQSAADFFKKAKGVPPGRLGELVSSGVIKYIPDDPAGGRFYIDGKGVVKSTKPGRTLGVFTKGGGK